MRKYYKERFEKALRELAQDLDAENPLDDEAISRMGAELSRISREGEVYDNLPVVFHPLGAEVSYGGRKYVVRLRKRVNWPREACSGCGLRERGCATLRVQCSKWDREDGLNVWFIDKEEEDA